MLLILIFQEYEEKKNAIETDNSNDMVHPGKCEIYVGNLPFSTNEAFLQNVFEQYGTIKKCNILKNPDGRSKGVGFITFEKAQAAQVALDDAQSITIDGR